MKEMAEASLEQVTQLAVQLRVADKLALIESLVHELRREGTTIEQSRTVTDASARLLAPRSLYGIWRDKFPPDADVEAAIREIRDEWKEELEMFAEDDK
jgi:hypothetical protein